MDSPSPRTQQKVLQFLTQQHARIINLANRLDDTETAFGAFDIDGAALPHYKVFDRKGKVRLGSAADPDHPFDEKDIERAVVIASKRNNFGKRRYRSAEVRVSWLEENPVQARSRVIMAPSISVVCPFCDAVLEN